MSRAAFGDLDALLAVADHGSFRAAAVQLGRSPSAVSHAIASLEGLREGAPDLESYELRERVNDEGTIEGAENAEARTLARFDAAMELRGRVDAYGEALHDYLAGWPEKERGDEEERLRDLVFGE